MSHFAHSRHRSRERALELAYEALAKDRSLGDVLDEQRSLPDPYVVAILSSTDAHRSEIEALINEHSIAWTFERLAVIDRLIMTLALGELLSDDPPPVGVVLDEAVELAKTFSTESSGSFVNGVLSACVENLK